MCLVGLGLDMSERQQMEQHLRASELKFRQLFENSSFNITIVDGDGVILMLNEANARMMGGCPADFIGRSLREFDPEHAEGFITRYRQIMQTGVSQRSEDCFPVADGVRWFSSELQPVYDVDGQAVAVQVVAFDITARHRAEEALAREKQLSDDIIDSMPGVLYMLDQQGCYLRWNAALAEQTGYTPQEMVGKSALELIAEADRARVLERIQHVFVSGEASVDAGLLARDGRIMPHSFNGKRIMVDGQPCLIGLGIDITARQQMEETLRSSELRYRQLFDNSSINITLIDGDGVILLLNESTARLLGGCPEDFIGRSMRDFDPAHAADFIARYRQIMQSGVRQRSEDCFPGADGVARWFSSEYQPLFDAQGRAVAVQVISLDISARRSAEEALQRSEELWKFALEGAGDSVWDWDVVHQTVKYSPRWKEQLGYGPDEDPGDWLLHVHPEDHEAVQRINRGLLSGEMASASYELRMRRKDGTWIWFLARGMVVRADATGLPLRVVGTCADITAQKDHQRQLEYIAHYDALTGLPNRLLLALHLKQAIAQSQRRNQSLAVVYLDLDGFKAVNDRYGHASGDELLVALAQRMKLALREGDTLARIGGDEFIALLIDLEQPQDCEPVLERLLQAASAQVDLGGMSLKVSTSIGVTLYPGDGADADQLIRHADQAMYLAKQAGKNRYQLFDVERDAQVQQLHAGIEGIRLALARGEFVLYYQPKVNMRSGAVVGAEALIRWQHPEQGLLPPGLFLPITEGHDISVALGEWVIEAALRQLETWQQQALARPVSVNIAAYHLQTPRFVERLAALLAAYPAVAPALLELEVLETSALGDLVGVGRILQDCRALGVGVALDDFGTGYSSLAYLKRLPAGVLKIDQSFVRDMLEDSDDLAIVEGIVRLAQVFRREVVAEGVETAAHGQVLLQLGCNLAQGYGIARPMPAAAWAAWLCDWQQPPEWRG
jgi:diguanylate cyclase (GGDEF)-like protein/PAS domain S-box-containing protein